MVPQWASNPLNPQIGGVQGNRASQASRGQPKTAFEGSSKIKNPEVRLSLLSVSAFGRLVPFFSFLILTGSHVNEGYYSVSMTSSIRAFYIASQDTPLPGRLPFPLWLDPLYFLR